MTSPLANAFRFHMQHGRTATKAIADARADMAAGKARYPGPVKPYAAVCWQSGEPGLGYVQNAAGAGLREIGAVHDISDTPIRHSGWYTDPYQDTFRDGTGLCWGVVYQLPSRGGKPVYVAGYQFGGVDGGPTLDLATFHDEVRDACYAADSMAEHAAEDEREYQTAYAAGSRFADKGEELTAERAELRQVLAERRQVRGTAGYPALCKAIRRQVETMLNTIAELKEARAELRTGNFDRLDFYPNARLKGAFNEGAGEEVLS